MSLERGAFRNGLIVYCACVISCGHTKCQLIDIYIYFVTETDCFDTSDKNDKFKKIKKAKQNFIYHYKKLKNSRIVKKYNFTVYYFKKQKNESRRLSFIDPRGLVI